MHDHNPTTVAPPGRDDEQRPRARRRTHQIVRDPVARAGLRDPWRLVFWSRYFAIPLLALIAGAAPEAVVDVPLEVSVLVAASLPVTIAADRLRRRWPVLPERMIAVDALIAAVVVLAHHDALGGAALALLADVAMVAAAAGRGAAVRAVLWTGAVMLFPAIVVQGLGVLLLAVLVVAGTFVAIVVGNVADGQRELHRNQEHLLAGIDGIVWTMTTNPPATLTVAGRVGPILGRPPEEIDSPESWIVTIHPDDRARVLDHLSRTMTGEIDGEHVEYRLVASDGREVRVRDTQRCERDASGRPVRVRGLVIDVTDLRRIEEDLSHHRDIVQHIHTALLVVRLADPGDPRSLTLVSANPAAARLLGRDATDHIGERLIDVFPVLRDGPIPARLVDTITVGVGFDSEMPLVDEPDSPVLAVHTFPMPDRSATMALQDVTDRARVQARLRHQALHDALTGLPNRVLLNDRLRKGLSRAQRSGEPIAIMIMDLNHFKEVNDTLGHHSGDVLLSEVAQRLRDALREADTVARLGGDEFAILLTTNATRSGAIAVAEKIGRLVERPVDVDGVSIQVSASIGIAFFPEHADDADGLARRADVAMYVAKRTSSTFAVYAPEDDRSSIRRLTLLGELRQAITQDQLVLHHQPTVELSTGHVLRTEALLRWKHPTHGLMPPGEFMELAEMSGVVQPLTRWVLRQSVRQVKQLSVDGQFLHVAVNVSARNLYEPDLVDWIVGLLEEERFPGERLTLEITESLLMDDPLLALGVLRRLKAFGISLSIDDFGTGYSSLSYLRDLPIDEIKIDQSFVGAMSLPGGDDTIVRSVIDLGHNLGLAVVAEGVEDWETLERLVELGCDRAQGFLLSQPLPADELAVLLESDRFRRFAHRLDLPDDW
ncbi:putative bifunctional diguanylate cyclase/phosphodiesterase [Actinomarinicola tropica]|uniref:EAL domain-containing protein n=1 Tax=Actinomarinicola tropica TaxID=2789776 RepID=A0A5Q2RP96_9ACTN|nr:GGDEF domain-containing phosphodiesterase [Actinomarinicola tropica]QGG95927.1 EAL domain-containing protein [Actinomarinicola tropica]